MGDLLVRSAQACLVHRGFQYIALDVKMTNYKNYQKQQQQQQQTNKQQTNKQTKNSKKRRIFIKKKHNNDDSLFRQFLAD